MCPGAEKEHAQADSFGRAAISASSSYCSRITSRLLNCPAQRSLVEHHIQPGSVRPCQDVLAGHPEVDRALYEVKSRVRARGDQLPRVPAGLQQRAAMTLVS